MTDYGQEQEMEIEALEAILMDEFEEIHSSESGLNTSNRCFQIIISPQDDDTDESTDIPVQLGLVFSHTVKYPDEPPLLNVKSIRGIQADYLKILKEKLEQEVIVPHGEPVTVETFLAWREIFEAELALERAKLMPESALTAPKEKKLTGRLWYESGKAKGAVAVNEGSDEEDEEEIDFDDDDFEDDEEDMLEHYLADKSDSSHASRRAA
ncbi:uncharacterized protein LOC7470594 isoform X3 [Populus trichocarpa]|uniref:uncharacterized protein LOC7470594 isoform X3 n=1 Tax=Populus trichocarpa TaxID=3694 RepID=UPI000D1898B4|nr:uncharacterized protein LOC7470594 isoform X3 [Populus trichocarpa]|eukprot:XP_024448016.1 RWD domain-containing protein 1 isoform X3 [Populus trichocarpa]